MSSRPFRDEVTGCTGDQRKLNLPETEIKDSQLSVSEITGKTEANCIGTWRLTQLSMRFHNRTSVNLLHNMIRDVTAQPPA